MRRETICRAQFFALCYRLTAGQNILNPQLITEKKYDSFLELEGEIAVGEVVSCRFSPEAIVTTIADNGAVTVKLLPYGTEKTFTSLADGKIRRYEPDLCSYSRNTRIDTTPVYVIETIDEFYCQHVDIISNKRDKAKRLHPFCPGQI